ncbi:MAG: UDP-N-acetylmuramate dehydrogenase [Bacteroidaceae bacterium]|nr:UDP-N-acetylmuramate dehydrogenase [Bacteroidaceae bacterium]
MKLTSNASLLPHNTFGIEANAACLVEYDTVADLTYFLENERMEHPDWQLLHIGDGSNLLFLKDYEGYVLRSDIRLVQALPQGEDSVLVRVGAGVVHDELIASCLQQGWYGLENLSLIPGQVGAAAVQNIGAYGVEAGGLIERVEAVDLQSGAQRVFTNEECRYGYRQSVFKREYKGRYAVTFVTYRLSRTFTPQLGYGGVREFLTQRGVSLEAMSANQLRDAIIQIRRDKLPDPKVEGNAGSFFVNPVVERSVYERLSQLHPSIPCYPVDARHVKIPAGWLIEQSGWKGRQLGRAAVHDRQALVLVNKGGAMGEDIVRLCEAVCEAVKRRFGIQLTPEVNFI